MTVGHDGEDVPARRAVAAAPRGLRGRRGRLLAGAVVVVAVVACWLRVVLSPAYGPVGFQYAGQDTVGFRDVRAGEILVYGNVLLWNTGDEPARLHSVRLVGDTTGLDVGPVLTAGPARSVGAVAAARGQFPPRPDLGVPLVPIAASLVPPGAGQQAPPTVEILIRIQVRELRSYRFTGTEISYSYRGHRYTFTDRTHLELCPRAQCSSSTT